MTAHRLTEREQRILDELERDLRRDRRLDRWMRTFRPGRRSVLARLAAYRPRRRTVALLSALSVTLMVTGIVTSEPAVIWAFALVWPVTLFAAFRLLCRCTEGTRD
ncbi:hypothetical protein SUDANB58_04730 [Streptomyces sp. enrichment culture]|uniref:DUF3040 domain-containing protein n=1 Tax=Streptomyces sp. enrichment culture TaxID=1795815 RepID=UPI003F5536DF